jgi:hypothetical protein
MATPEEIAAFRLIINEQDGATYSDQMLSDRLDAAVSERRLASNIWLEKAAKYASLVDIQEGTSRRSLSQLQEHALLMAARYSGLAEDDEDPSPTTGKRTTTRAIERA